jgi:hypothetical protein
VVYQQPASLFVQRATYHAAPSEPSSPVKGAARGNGAAAAADANGHAQVDQSTGLLSTAEADLLGDLGGDFGGPASSAPSMTAPSAAAAAGGGGGGLLDFDLGDFGSSPAAAAAPPPAPVGFSLQQGFKLMPGVFQERWRGLAPCHQYSDTLNMATVAALAANNHQDFCAHMGQAGINTMASGGQAPAYK